MKIKLFAKEKPGLREAIDFLETITDDLEIYIGKLKDKFPIEAKDKKCDLIISYISPWIIPNDILNLAEKYAINFHPGPPEFPGIGCTNFALYEGAKKFGVTCHIMKSKVDSGKIISVKRFPIFQQDNVKTLTDRCYAFILEQFYEVVNDFYESGKLNFINETWKRKPFTRKQLDELSEIHFNMSDEEINKRIRATYYPGMPYPFIEINNNKFVYNPR